MPWDVCRAGVVALVCKSWNKVERESPHQPTHMCFDGEQPFSRAALVWLLRDTSKLLGVALHGVNYWGDFWGSQEELGWTEAAYCTQSLLTHLADKAPVLKSLMIQPPRAALEAGKLNFLPLLGGLKQLERLTITDWWYLKEDFSNFSQLDKLHNLKVLSCTSPPASATPITEKAKHEWERTSFTHMVAYVFGTLHPSSLYSNASEAILHSTQP